jgi:hypothetical protein
MTDDSPYQERYCAYVDILGFTELVGDIHAGKVKFAAVRDLLQQIHAPRESEAIGRGEIDFQAQSISDAIALSTRLTIPGLGVLFDTLEQLSLGAIHEGYFTRGALCRGRLYHNPNMVFGEALIKAYRLESEVARYPRIMLTKDVVNDAMSSNLKHYFIEQIKQADDGPYFLNIFRYLTIQLAIIKARKEDTPESDKILLRFKTLREMIQRRFDESVDNPKHFEKVQWFANYWNISFPKEQEGFEMINGAGLFKMRFLDT